MQNRIFKGGSHAILRQISQYSLENLITAVAIPLAAGGLSAWITMDGMKAFETVNQPPLTPPMWLFPVVWSILFVLMGIASYLVVMQKVRTRKPSPCMLYSLSLIFLVHLVLQPGMVSFRLFVAGRSVDPDHRHYRCLLPHLEACRMADAALSGMGGVRGVSESGGVVAEPVSTHFY